MAWIIISFFTRNNFDVVASKKTHHFYSHFTIFNKHWYMDRRMMVVSNNCGCLKLWLNFIIQSSRPESIDSLQSSQLDYPCFSFLHLVQQQTLQMIWILGQLFSSDSAISVSVFIFFSSTIKIFRFTYFLLTNLAIVRARLYGYGSIFDVVAGVICSYLTADSH